MSGGTVDLDAKLTALLQTIVARLPNEKKVSSGVVLQLLRGKYAEVYPESYLASKQEFITNTLDDLFSRRASSVTSNIHTSQACTTTTTVSAAPQRAAAVPRRDESSKTNSIDADESCSDVEESVSSSSGDDQDEDDESGSSDSGASGSNSSSSNSSGTESSISHEDENGTVSSTSNNKEDSRSSNRDNKHATAQPDRRKRDRERANDDDGAICMANGDAASGPCDSDAPSARCREMVACLKKLSHHIRSRAADESAQSYLQDYLIPTFVRHRLDPERYSNADIRRYRALKEVELLQQDGASLQLDRRQRMGRGYRHIELENINNSDSKSSAPIRRAGEERVTSSTVPTVVYTTPKFLDDEDEDE